MLRWCSGDDVAARDLSPVEWGAAHTACGPGMPDHFVWRYPIGALAKPARSHYNDRVARAVREAPPKPLPTVRQIGREVRSRGQQPISQLSSVACPRNHFSDTQKTF